MTNLLHQAATTIDSTGFIMAGKNFIEARFGVPGLIAAAILLLSILAILTMKIVKISFDVLRFVVVPSVAITFVATYFLPYSFSYILPVTVAFFSIVLIAKS
ncbi:membrane hypothetical protein [Candidatus Zixiibacteriota bacterium]|nr:membrane hypothetical protein [candidate division Zixibacteria bacterium]